MIDPPPAGSPEPGSGPLAATRSPACAIVRQIIRLSPILPLAFLLLVTSFGVRSFKSWLQWWGIPILITGLNTWFGWHNHAYLEMGLEHIYTAHIPSYLPTAIADIGLEVAIFIVGTVVRSAVIQAIILIFVGLLAWAGSMFVKSRPA